MSRTILKFTLLDQLNERELEFKTTLAGENIDHYYEAFEAFLLAAGFLQESIDRRYEQ